jgi:hypothetical protein
MTTEAQVVVHLTLFGGSPGKCKECGKEVWWLMGRHGKLIMVTRELQVHEHSKPAKPNIRSVVRDPGGEVK